MKTLTINHSKPKQAVLLLYISYYLAKPTRNSFITLLEQFHEIYGFYPKYPVADAGYGSYNNYIYCEQHGMEKFMKFPIFKKE